MTEVQLRTVLSRAAGRKGGLLMWTRALSVPIGLIMLLIVGGGLAYAEDAPAAGAEEMTAPEVQPVEGTEGEAIEHEVKEAPAYEEPYEETMRERYFRMTRDFISPRQVGLGRVGRVPVTPRGIIKAGPFRFSPFLTTAVGWQSNPNLNEDDKDSSWFWEGRIGVTADASFLKDRLSINGMVDMLYRDYTRDSVNDNWDGSVGLSARYDLPVGFYIHAGAIYSHEFYPIDEIDLPDRAERDGWDFFFDFGFDEMLSKAFGGRFKVEVGFDVSNRNYSDHEFTLADRTEFEGHIRVSYSLRQELALYVEYAHGEITKNNTRLNDGSYDNLVFGIDGAYGFGPGQRLQGTIFAGVQRNEFDDQKVYRVGSDTLHTDDGDDKNDLKAGVQLRYLMGTRTQIRLIYIRTTAFSLEGDYQTVDRIDLSGDYTIIRGLVGRVGGYGEWDRPSMTSDVYRYGGGAGVRYMINDFLDADLNYEARYRQDTDKLGNDYEDYRVILGLTFYLR